MSEYTVTTVGGIILIKQGDKEIGGGDSYERALEIVDFLNEETAPLHATIASQAAQIAALEAEKEAILSSLTPLLSEMAEFGTSRQFHAITLGQLKKWAETALRITQLAKLAALEDVDIDAIANKVFAKLDSDKAGQAARAKGEDTE